jgi:hypothetical protein
MHFSFLSFTLLIGSVAALPITVPLVAKRDTAVVDAYLARMSADLQVLKISLKGLPSGGSQDVANQKARKLLDELRTLGHTMETGGSAVKGGPSIGAFETIGLTSQVTSMSSLVNDVTVGFNTENTKRMIWFAGKKEAQNQFAIELTRNSRAYADFAAALISKLPVLEQGLAGVFKSAFGSLIQPAVTVSLLSYTRIRSDGCQLNVTGLQLSLGLQVLGF